MQVPVEIVQSNLFLGLEGHFDLIIANLPYIGESEREDLSKEVRHDPEIALFSGSDGLDLLRLFASQCSPFLNSGGLIALEVGHSQGETVCDLLREGGMTEISLRSDLNDIPRFPLARVG